MWGWAIKHNDGLAYVPEGEPDSFVCECAYSEPDQSHSQGSSETCDWYSRVSYNLTVLTEKGKQLQENKETANRARAHRRLAMKLQAAGYKGSKHPKALERASKERDQLL